MKKKIHPQYYNDCQVICACKNNFKIGSTSKQINTEICSACHPFYTGKDNIIDTAKRVKKFEEKLARQKKKNA